MSESECKKLSDLRVVDLRVELEKRGLDRNGVKQVLMQRLKEALEEEGLDPETYSFDSSDPKKPKPAAQTEDVEDKPVSKDAEPKKEEKANSTETVTEKKTKPKAEIVKTETVATTPAKEQPKTNVAVKVSNSEDSSKKSTVEEDEDNIRLTLDDEDTLQDVESETAEKVRDDDSIAGDKKKKEAEDNSKQDSQSEKERTGIENRKAGEKLQKKVGTKSNPTVVWVSNVAQNTRASELKSALSVHGKVSGAKIVVNARYPGSSCFGYVTMGSIEDVDNVIAKLNNTELNGHMIKIEKFDQVRADQMKQMHDKGTRGEKSNKEKKEDKKDGDKADTKDKESDSVKADSSERKSSVEKTRPGGPRGRSPGGRFGGKPRGGILTFTQIKEERDRQKFREKERILREESKRRQEEYARQKEIERRQRQEAMRLQREKEKLRIEKEKFEREKAELVRMERERQRLEREKLAREKVELERTLYRLEEDRRGNKRPASYDRFDDRKRSLGDRFEAPPAPRFEPPSGKHEGKTKQFGPGKPRSSHEDYTEKRGRDFDGPMRSGGGRQFGNRGPRGGGKESRYERERDESPHQGGHRYDNHGPNEQRFESRNSNNWSGPQKNFSSKPWEKNDWRSAHNDRWMPNNNSGNRPSNNNSNMNMAPICPPPPGISNYNENRYDFGKPMGGSSMRKY